MSKEELYSVMNGIAKGDTSYVEALFKKPGGRKYLESIVLIIVTTLPGVSEDKDETFRAFLQTLDKMEVRIKHQKEGQKILKQLYS